MTLEGTFTFNGPRQTVWTLLQDPAVLDQLRRMPAARN